MKIAVTGAKGLLGWHASARLHAQNCAARFQAGIEPFELVQLDRATYRDERALARALRDVEVVLHFAGINRGEDVEIEAGNPEIALRLLTALDAAGARPHIVYANSIHSARDTPYGRSKRLAGEILCDCAERYTDVVLPHIFGECARPFYNNVTATLIDQLWNGEEPRLDPNGRVKLMHAGEAAQIAINSGVQGTTGRIVPEGRDIGVIELYERLSSFHSLYMANIFPPLDDPFEIALFNSYRVGGYPKNYPMMLKQNADHRGTLFETAKGGTSPQSFMSTTKPGKTRGDHFHLDLVERFLVVQGKAVIRIRKVLTNEVHEFYVEGDEPAAIDMPPLHTHHIENIGSTDLLTFFWSHHVFDPASPDTYADPV